MESDHHLRPQSLVSALVALAIACTSCATAPPGQEAANATSPTAEANLQLPAPQESGVASEPNRMAVYSETLSLVLGTESFQALFRQNSRLQDGFWEIEYLQNRDDDLVLNTHLQRVGKVPDTSLKLGVGIGAYAVAFDKSEHEVFALTLSGGVSYDLGTKIPTALSLEVSVAPEITTFKDGESLVDTVLKYEAQITPNAIAILGGRYFDAETSLSDEVSHEIFVGVRLGF